MRRQTKDKEGIGPMTLVLLLVASLLFGRLLAEGIDRTFKVEDAQRAAYQRTLVVE